MGSTPPVLIVGGGLAGLTAALSFAAEGIGVRLFEAASAFQEIGAGLQLSPNATHILRRLGVLDKILPRAVQPAGVILNKATTLRQLTEIPLAPSNIERWGAPYLVSHRAAIQAAMLAAVADQPLIRIEMGAVIRDAVIKQDGVSLSYERDGQSYTIRGHFLVAADGVWSGLRGLANPAGGTDSLFSGMTAWRTMIDRASANSLGLYNAVQPDRVTTFLDPHAHLVAYPLSETDGVNLVAITRGGSPERGWDHQGDPAPLQQFLTRLPLPLRDLAGLQQWRRWPLYAAPETLRWTGPRFALIGDAAHAMMPFAAQGAAMAIEDAAVLAACVADAPADLDAALSRYEEARRPRIARVLQRGRLNKMAWNASGPIAIARDIVFRLKGNESLARDLDWLYGWKEPRHSSGVRAA